MASCCGGCAVEGTDAEDSAGASDLGDAGWRYRRPLSPSASAVPPEPRSVSLEACLGRTDLAQLLVREFDCHLRAGAVINDLL